MSWPVLPRVNPGLPCMVGNPKPFHDRRCAFCAGGFMRGEKGKRAGGHVYHVGCYAAHKGGEKKFDYRNLNPESGHCAGCGRRVPAPQLAMSAAEMKAHGVSEYYCRKCLPAGRAGRVKTNPAREGRCSFCHGGFMRGEKEHVFRKHPFHEGCLAAYKSGEKSFSGFGYERDKPDKPALEGPDPHRCAWCHGGFMRGEKRKRASGAVYHIGCAAAAGVNPKLMVLNPSDGVLAGVERKLGRRLTRAEITSFEQARREFKTFQGRDVTAQDLIPVSAPPGTPLFVSMIGRLDRMDYTVTIDSDRKGGWTHEAGDHGRHHKTKHPFLVGIPGRKRHNYTIVEPKGAHTYFKPTHGLMG